MIETKSRQAIVEDSRKPSHSVSILWHLVEPESWLLQSYAMIITARQCHETSQVTKDLLIFTQEKMIN